ncbi:MAG: hypothetical protein FJW36_21890 [Acidobacteria bacterium]|nr:hypothetical protein [Acidobacteriota bacterium]
MSQTVLVESPVQRSCIFNLRYEYLRRDESIGPSPNKLFSDPFDLEPNHFHFLRLDQGAPHAAIRASPDFSPALRTPHFGPEQRRCGEAPDF